MRSRFTAFARGDAAYLIATWDPSTRPRAVELDPGRRWTRLDILDVVDGSPFADAGVVEFRAHYREGAARGSQHERSRFVRRRGRWCYLDAVPH